MIGRREFIAGLGSTAAWPGGGAGAAAGDAGDWVARRRRLDRTNAEIISEFLCRCYVQNGAKMASRPKLRAFQKGRKQFPLGNFQRGVNKGRILVHNQIEHSVNATSGRNGFQAWTQPEPAPQELVECNCGWAGLPHYRTTGDQ
jgi:hypothetical protein